MAQRRDPNWFRHGEFLPIATLADSYTGPIVLTDKTQTIQWFVKKANKLPTIHREHVRDDNGQLVHEDSGEPHVTGKPVIESREIKPVFWAIAQVVR